MNTDKFYTANFVADKASGSVCVLRNLRGASAEEAISRSWANLPDIAPDKWSLVSIEETRPPMQGRTPRHG